MRPRILIVRVGAMGDVLHAMPAVAALRAAMPTAEIGWVIEPHWSPLLQVKDHSVPRSEEMPLVDRVHLAPTKGWSRRPLSLKTARGVLELRQELREVEYDIAIDLQGSVRSAVIAKMSGAARIIGSSTPWERPARWMYSQRVDVRAAHVVEQAAEIVSAAVDTRFNPTVATVPLDEAAERWCNDLLRGVTQRTVLLAPAAGWGAKQWPADKFAAVAIALAAEGCRVLVNAAGGQDPVAAAVLQASNGAADPVECTLAQLIAVLRRTALVIAGDTGPLHLASALGVAVVGLYGPTDPARTGPWGAPSRVLRSEKSITDHSRHTATEVGLADVPVEDALTTARDLLHDAPERMTGA